MKVQWVDKPFYYRAGPLKKAVQGTVRGMRMCTTLSQRATPCSQ